MKPTLLSLLSLAAALAFPGAAAAQVLAVDPDEEIRDYDEEAESYSRFWESALGPGDATYGDLVAQAVSIMEQKLGADDARTVLRDAIARRPEAPEAHFWLGVLERGEGDFAGCARGLARALEVDPDFEAPSSPLMAKEWGLEFELGVCLALSGELSAAARRLTRVTTRHSSCAELRRDPACYGYQVPWRLGEILMALGRLEEAITWLEAARAMTSALEVRYALAIALERDEQLFEGKKQLDSVVGQDLHLASLTASSRLYIPAADRSYYLGLAHQIRDDHGRAAIYFRHYLEAAPRSPWVSRARSHLAEAARARIGSDAELRGARLETEAAIEAIYELEPRFESCVAEIPDQIFEVTLEIQSTGRRGAERSAAVRWFNLLRSETESARIQAATACLREVARDVRLPRPDGPSGAKAAVTFTVWARSAAAR